MSHIDSWDKTSLENELRSAAQLSKLHSAEHAKMADYYNTLNLRLMILLAAFGVFNSGFASYGNKYFPSEYNDICILSLGILYVVANTFFNVKAPSVNRQLHLKGAGDHGFVVSTIKKQLAMPPNMRQNAADFYDWIMREQADAIGDAPPVSVSTTKK
jgi:hypothetical protein